MRHYFWPIRLIVFFVGCYYGTADGQVRYPCHRYRVAAEDALKGTRQLTASARSDSLNVLHYDLTLFIDPEEEQVSGHCRVRMTATGDGLKGVALDLLGLNVSRVLYQDDPLDFHYNDTLLTVPLKKPISPADTFSLTVHYEGSPVTDPSGWGGFYFEQGKAFNLGVGFQADPHNYGRVWFPCVDNFVDRATYSFHITVPEKMRAICSGNFQGSERNGKGREFHWELDDPVPTYLVSVGVGEYEFVEWTYRSITGDTVPVRIAAQTSDTGAVRSSFSRLEAALNGYEKAFGPYHWDRVGYLLVPFAGGAMEHATNIAYPERAVGSMASEDLMVHELSHHWWGNLVTCASASDMWINEGMATYSEFLFQETVGGRPAYLKAVKDNHKKALMEAAARDGGKHRAVYGPPHAYTYGSHVYDKGGDVVHTLRSFLGDSLFFAGLQELLRTHAFDTLSSCTFRDHLDGMTDKDVKAFFDQWIFQRGYPHFAVDSWKIEAGKVRVNVEQQRYYAPDYFTGVPLTLTLMTHDGRVREHHFQMSGSYHTETFQSEITPAYVGLNLGGAVSDATLTDTLRITSEGTYEGIYSDLTLKLEHPQEAFVALTHHLTLPAPLQDGQMEFRLTKQHYWSVDGVWNGELKGELRTPYDGRSSQGGLDALMMNEEWFREENLVVFFRSSGGEDWQLLEKAEVRPGSEKTDRKGTIALPSVRKGDYVLGLRK